MSRTHRKHVRTYIGGYDFSGDARGIPGLLWEFEEAFGASQTDEIMNAVLGHPSISPGVLNAFFNDDATGIHTVLEGENGNPQILTLPVGLEADPVAGVPVFAGEFLLNGYQANPEGIVATTCQFGGVHWDAPHNDYAIPWGVLLHPSGAETAANTGSADSDFGASSSKGGFGILHVLATNGTCTFSIDHSANDVTYANLLTFALAGSSIGAEIFALGKTATVNRYLRWQLALGTATSITFVMSFVRNFLD